MTTTTLAMLSETSLTPVSMLHLFKHLSATLMGLCSLSQVHGPPAPFAPRKGWISKSRQKLLQATPLPRPSPRVELTGELEFDDLAFQSRVIVTHQGSIDVTCDQSNMFPHAIAPSKDCYWYIVAAIALAIGRNISQSLANFSLRASPL